MGMLWNARRRWLGCGLVLAVLVAAGALIQHAIPSRWVRVFWVLLPDGDVVEYGWLYPGGLGRLNPLYWDLAESRLVWHHGGQIRRCGTLVDHGEPGELRATPDLRGIWYKGDAFVWLDRGTGEMGVHGETLQPTPAWALGGGGILLATEEVDPP